MMATACSRLASVEGKLGYEATAKKVVDLEKLYGELDKKVFAYALLAAASGAVIGTLFTGLPAWLERHPLQKASFVMSSALVRLQ